MEANILIFAECQFCVNDVVNLTMRVLFFPHQKQGLCIHTAYTEGSFLDIKNEFVGVLSYGSC